MNYPEVVRSFGFRLDSARELESIYDPAPVFRLHNGEGEWIVKRTQKPLARGYSVAKWTASLAAQGVRVVTPAAGFGENPRLFVDEEEQESVWVVYPFITGATYRGDPLQIEAAGDLLGKIHAVGASTDFGLKVTETIVSITAAELDEDVAAILEQVRHAFPEYVERADSLLRERIQQYIEQAQPRLLATRLPVANCTWDYKAVNLVYEGPSAPVLIDPDNGGRIPRAYDLAIAALLFHNEGDGPGRLFTAAEWRLFLRGYRQHVQWTALEKSCWEEILLCAWIDEALWLLKDDETGWARPKQSGMLLSLLLSDHFVFALPPDW